MGIPLDAGGDNKCASYAGPAIDAAKACGYVTMTKFVVLGPSQTVTLGHAILKVVGRPAGHGSPFSLFAQTDLGFLTSIGEPCSTAGPPPGAVEAQGSGAGPFVFAEAVDSPP